MIPKNQLIVMKPNSPADDALRRIFRENKGRIFVCEDDRNYEQQELQGKESHRQRLVGVISKTDLLNIAKERAEFEKAVGKLRSDKYDKGSRNGNVTNSSSDGGEGERGKITTSVASSKPSASLSSFANLRSSLISRRRVLLVVFGIILFVSAYSVGSMLVKINSSEAQILKKQFREQIKGINGFGIFFK